MQIFEKTFNVYIIYIGTFCMTLYEKNQCGL